MKPCPHCGAELADEAYACALCGKPLLRSEKPRRTYTFIFLGAAIGLGIGCGLIFSEFLPQLILIPLAPLLLTPIVCLVCTVVGMLVGAVLGLLLQRQ